MEKGRSADGDVTAVAMLGLRRGIAGSRGSTTRLFSSWATVAPEEISGQNPATVSNYGAASHPQRGERELSA